LTARAWVAGGAGLSRRPSRRTGERPSRALPASTERDAVMALLLGRAALAAGRPRTRSPSSRRETSGVLPNGWLGPCRLLAGQAADLQGLRARALAFYKRAESTPGFGAREAAMAYQSRPFKAETQ